MYNNEKGGEGVSERLKDLFLREGIEFFSVLDFEKMKIANQRLASSIGFTPRSVIVFLVPYFVDVPENISVYAASYDYHIVIKDISSRLTSEFKKLFPEGAFSSFTDHSPIDERYAAVRGGLGIFGDNGVIINEKYGSFVFLADIITDLDPSVLGGDVFFDIKGCEGCGRCKAVCPTGILRGQSDKCLSEITQRKGELSEAELSLMRKCDTVWGCDACQLACPHNANPKATPVLAFYKNRIKRLTEEYLDSLGEEEFKKRAFSWRGRGVLKRNLENERKKDS